MHAVTKRGLLSPVPARVPWKRASIDALRGCAACLQPRQTEGHGIERFLPANALPPPSCSQCSSWFPSFPVPCNI